MKIYLSDERIDKAAKAYQDEYYCWCWRLNVNSRYELVHDTSPVRARIVDEAFQEVIKLSKRQCRDQIDADAWLETYRGRAAMRAALGAL